MTERPPAPHEVVQEFNHYVTHTLVQSLFISQETKNLLVGVNGILQSIATYFTEDGELACEHGFHLDAFAQMDRNRVENMQKADPNAKTGGDAAEGDTLRRWWLDRARGEIEPLIAKAREYGGHGRALDLEEIGRGLVQSGVSPWRPGTVHAAPGFDLNSAQYQELGVYFYLLGKFARWTAAVSEGRPVSDDTLLDIGIYVRMVQRIRDVGGWPI